jgi:hypothetical protein
VRKNIDIIEVNTRVWLKELSEKYGKKIQFDNIPEEEILFISDQGFDALWLMGVWEKSLASADIAIHDKSLLSEFKDLLPELDLENDVGSSPYSVAGYGVNTDLGSIDSIKSLRERLKQKEISLILDFVPNHVAIDHPWVQSRPNFFINATLDDLARDAQSYFQTKNGIIIAHGKDPYFPAWTDTAQLNYFNPDTRLAMVAVLKKLADLCDGIRCDMAILILKRIQKQIWGSRTVYPEPGQEFWQDVIPEIKRTHPKFIFIAEAYWGLEEELIGYGFDFVYDINFYHALLNNDISAIKMVLDGSRRFQDNRLKFIENHDEMRALAALGHERIRPAVLILALSPGGHLFYQGQLKGFSKRLPVQLLKRPGEDVDEVICSFYGTFFKVLKEIKKQSAGWKYFEPEPYGEEDLSYKNVIAFYGGGSFIAIINYAHMVAEVILKPQLVETSSNDVVFKDMLSLVEIRKSIIDIKSKGLHISVNPYGFFLFKIEIQSDLAVLLP